MNGAVDSTTASQVGIRRIDDRVDLLPSDIALEKFEATGTNHHKHPGSP